MAESTELAVTQALVPEVVFAPGGVEAIIDKIKAEVGKVSIDISTQQGRQQCASLAYKVARSKTALDGMGKELGLDHYNAWKRITAERSKVVEELDALRDAVRRPLTDWENAEKSRVAGHESAIAALQESPEFYVAGNSADDLRRRLAFLGNQPERDWQEFEKRAKDVLANEVAKTKVALADAERKEAAAAEASRIAAEKVENERKAREAAIAAAARREAEEKAAALAAAAARRAEEEKRAAIEKVEREKREAAELAAAAAENARREREAAEAAKNAAEERARKAEEERIAIEAKAKADAAAVAQKAERDRLAAIEFERQRAAAERASEAAAAAAREADKKHRAKINGEALSALITFCGLTDDQAKTVVSAIVRHEVPHVNITY